MSTKRSDLNNEKEPTFLDHLEILRWHLIRSFLAIIVFSIIAFIFRNIVFDEIILAPRTVEFWTNRQLCLLAEFLNVPSLCINQIQFQIINISMAGQFSTHIMVSFVAGLIVSFPYIFWEFWRFVKPALYEKEQKHSRGAIFFTSLLFMLGVAFGYFVIVPLSVHFLGSYNVSDQVNNQINLGSYISTVTSVVLACGVIFELPVLIFFLAKAGLVSSAFLKKYRRHSIIIILTLAAIITPPDIFSQILVCLPLIFLYEIGVIITKRIEKKAARSLA